MALQIPFSPFSNQIHGRETMRETARLLLGVFSDAERVRCSCRHWPACKSPRAVARGLDPIDLCTDIRVRVSLQFERCVASLEINRSRELVPDTFEPDFGKTPCSKSPGGNQTALALVLPVFLLGFFTLVRTTSPLLMIKPGKDIPIKWAI
jgi:hypothetical protein